MDYVTCQRANLRRYPHSAKTSKTYQRLLGVRAGMFGSILTADTVDMKSKTARVGVEGHTDFYCQKDLATGQCHAIPFKSKTTGGMTRIMGWTIAEDAGRRFYALRKVGMYTECYKSLIGAAEAHGLISMQSLPGVPESNGVIENLNRIILSGMRRALASSGLPTCWWPFAVQHAAFIRIIQIDAE